MGSRVLLINMYLENLLPGDGDPIREEIGPKGELASAPVEERCQKDLRGAAQVENFVNGGSNRSAGGDHIVDKEQYLPVDTNRYIGGVGHDRDGAASDIVPVEGGLDDSVFKWDPALFLKEPPEKISERDSTIGNAEHDGVATHLAAGDDLVGKG